MKAAPVEERSQREKEEVARRIAAAVSYITFIPALVLLLIRPYRRSSFVRFHSVQCLLCWVVGIAVGFVLRLLNLLLLFIPVVGPLLSLLITVLTILAALLIWVVLVVKAFQSERFGLLLLGDIAEQYSKVA